MVDLDRGIVECLFEADGKLLNIKFCRGDRAVIEADELRAQVHAALIQKKLPKNADPAQPPMSGLKRIDVKDFVANL